MPENRNGTVVAKSERDKSLKLRGLVIIPAYNEAENLPAVLADVAEHVPSMDVLVVDDCSIDATADVAWSLGSKVLQLPCNLGVGGAVQAGYIYARDNGYDLAVQFDGDGQHRADQIAALAAEVRDGVDLVVGSRLLGRRCYRFPAIRWIGAQMLRKLLAVLNGVHVTDPTSGFRASGKRMIGFFARHYPQSYLGDTVESLATAARHGMNIREIDARMTMTKKSSISNIVGVFRALQICLAILIDRMERPFFEEPGETYPDGESKP